MSVNEKKEEKATMRCDAMEVLETKCEWDDGQKQFYSFNQKKPERDRMIER